MSHAQKIGAVIAYVHTHTRLTVCVTCIIVTV